jgi:hypothetical protein
MEWRFPGLWLFLSSQAKVSWYSNSRFGIVCLMIFRRRISKPGIAEAGI